MMDRYLAQLDALGATLALTADHGMNDKFGADGQPNAIYLQDLLDEWLGQGAARVILPITDPYVVHHGALGSFATVYLPTGTDAAATIDRLAKEEGVQFALSNAEACARFELPPDRLGDVVVISEKNAVLGSSRSRPRPLGAGRAATLARRDFRAGGAVDVQSAHGRNTGEGSHAQLRYVRRGAESPRPLAPRRSWWRRRESNPRPQALGSQDYMLSLVV